MTDIAQAFDHGKAFIPFITVGDPDLETTERLVRAMVDAGADLIELGIPFSDPTAEGPVIQEANLRSLAGGTVTDDAFELVERLRVDIEVPLVFMTYANVVFSYSADAFMKRAEEAGLQGIILPDVPFEERGEFAQACADHGIAQISMIAPTSHERIRAIAREAQGFLYIVSSLGVTGERSSIAADIASMVALVREESNIPCAVGFGISTPQQACDLAKDCDGAIVGSAIVRLCAERGRDCVKPVSGFVREMTDALADV